MDIIHDLEKYCSLVLTNGRNKGRIWAIKPEIKRWRMGKAFALNATDPGFILALHMVH